MATTFTPPASAGICYCPGGFPYHLLPGTVCATFRVGANNEWELNWLHPTVEDAKDGIQELLDKGWDPEDTYLAMPV